MNSAEINELIKQVEDKNSISDGYHTFGELYEARCLLFVALIQAHKDKAWRASKNADGQKWEGWFVAGLNPKPGAQMTFHLPEKYWHRLHGIETWDSNPYYDGHTSADVLQRLDQFTRKIF